MAGASRSERPGPRRSLIANTSDSGATEIVRRLFDAVQIRLGGKWRQSVSNGLGPLARRLNRAGLTSRSVTLAGFLAALLSSLAIADGRLRTGVLPLLALLALDAVRSPLNLASGRFLLSRTEQIVTAVADRWSEAVVFSGLSWHLASNQEDRATAVVVAIIAAALTNSFIRATTHGVGLPIGTGPFERGQRMAVLGAALLIGDQVLEPILWVVLVLTSANAASLFRRALRVAAESEPPDRRRRSLRRRQLRVERRRDKSVTREALVRRHWSGGRT